MTFYIYFIKIEPYLNHLLQFLGIVKIFLIKKGASS